MDFTNMKKGLCTLKLEGLKKVYNSNGEEDPLLCKVTFSIIDFLTSGNNQRISKEEALKSASSFKLKPLLCQYKETTDFDNPDDDFGNHQEYKGTLRNGQKYMFTDTHAIGVSEKEAYLGVVKDNDNKDIDVLLCDFVLWKYRYPNEVLLINDFYEKGETLYSSCEYYYSSSFIEDGVEIVSNILFDGNVCLGRNIEPAYKSSKLISFNTKWNKAINQLNKADNSVLDINKNVKEDNLMENIFLKSLNNLSFGDIRDKLYEELAKVMPANDYFNLWISSYCVFDSYFVYETKEGDVWVNYKVPYTKGENDVITVSYDQKVKATWKGDLVEVSVMQTSINELNTTIATLTESLNAKDETITALNEKVTNATTEKTITVEKFNELTNTVTSLNAKVVELQPLADKYNTEQYEKSLNQAKDEYKEKFTNVGALDVFEKEETQELIKKSINSVTEESQTAKFNLAELIVNNIKTVLDNKPKISLNSVQSLKETKDLIGDDDEFEATYGFKR